jgi:hypothetical protein
MQCAVAILEASFAYTGIKPELPSGTPSKVNVDWSSKRASVWLLKPDA